MSEPTHRLPDGRETTLAGYFRAVVASIDAQNEPDERGALDIEYTVDDIRRIASLLTQDDAARARARHRDGHYQRLMAEQAREVMPVSQRPEVVRVAYMAWFDAWLNGWADLDRLEAAYRATQEPSYRGESCALCLGSGQDPARKGIADCPGCKGTGRATQEQE
jgi:hypothetical protein